MIRDLAVPVGLLRYAPRVKPFRKLHSPPAVKRRSSVPSRLMLTVCSLKQWFGSYQDVALLSSVKLAKKRFKYVTPSFDRSILYVVPKPSLDLPVE